MEYVFKYETQFNVGVRNSVAKAANVSNLRVDNVRVCTIITFNLCHHHGNTLVLYPW